MFSGINLDQPWATNFLVDPESLATNPSVQPLVQDRGNFRLTSPGNSRGLMLDSSSDARLHWLNRETHHTNVVLPNDAFTDGRRLLQQQLEAAGKSVLYLDSAQALDELEFDVTVLQGKLELADGPFRQLLHSGGVLMLNVSRFSPQQLEAFNTLMEEQLWQGSLLPYKVRVLCLCDKDALESNLLSGAQISRTRFQDLTDFPFPTLADLPVQEALTDYPAGTQIINLQHDPLWSRRLFGAPELDVNQHWQKGAGALAGPDFDHPLVVRNAPPDPRLMDHLIRWNNTTHNVRLESNLPEAEIARLIANKRPATQIEATLAYLDAPVCTVNSATIEEVLEPHYGAREGKLAQHPSLLAKTQAQVGQEGRISVFVTESLSSPLWHRLMQHPAGFDVAAAPGVEVPIRYAEKVNCIPIVERANYDSPVSFMHSADPALTQRSLAQNDKSTLLFITPTMRSDALLYALQRDIDLDHADLNKADIATSVSERTMLPPLSIKTHQLVNDLKSGKQVILQGLENNERLTRDLASLLHPPHYLYINGERLHFGQNGGLTGRLLVLTTDDQLATRHALSAALPDPVRENQWQAEACKMLAQQFPSQSPLSIQHRMNQLQKLFKILNDQNLIPRRDPPVNYPTLEMLFRHLFDIPVTASTEKSSHNDEYLRPDLRGEQFLNLTLGNLWRIPLYTHGNDASAQAANRERARIIRDLTEEKSIDTSRPRLIRALFKDLLIGDYQQGDQTQDTQYAYLKICLRILFPKEVNLMPNNSVDIQRLQELIGRVNHPNDIEQHGWMFLNTFSLDVIHALVGDDLSAAGKSFSQKEIAKKVLALVLDQTKKMGWALPPLLEHAHRDLAAMSTIANLLQAYQRPPKLAHEQRNLGKTELLLAQGNAVFLKGPPGTGKTHQVTQFQSGSLHTAKMADEGSQEFDNALASWAKADAPATLVIDEANLAGADNLAMLKSVFADHTLTVNGQRHSLTQEHRVIFTGNDDHLPGRTAQQVAKESIPTQRHKPMRNTILRTTFIDPILEKASPSNGQHDAGKEFIATQVQRIHEHLQRAFPERDLSPRNLEEFLAQLLSMFVTIPVANRPSLETCIARAALTVYASDLPTDDKMVVGVWLAHQLGFGGLVTPMRLNVDLSQTTLADTPSTQDLAGRIAWWLTTQTVRSSFNHKATTLGQQALLIEGPASRGKDTVVSEVLKMQGRAFVHINANPNNLQNFRDTLADACATGKVVLVSELNLLPSGILEGELNALLTGHAELPAALGFALIATVNPGDYAGRKSLSGALKNRLQRIVIEDYQPEELLQIAHHIALQLPRKMSNSSVRMREISDEKVTELVQMHHVLVAQLQDQPSELRPGIRQLKSALEQIQRQPNDNVRNIFDRIYAYYRVRAESTGDTNIQSESATPLLQEQLQRTLRLAHPDWLAQPTFKPGLKAKAPPVQSAWLSYDGNSHTIYFDERQAPERLCWALLKGTEYGLLSPFGMKTMPLDAIKNASRTNSRNSLAPGLGMSGVGQPDLEGELGTIVGDTRVPIYFQTSQETLKQELQTFPELRFSDAAGVAMNTGMNTATTQEIVLAGVSISSATQDQRRVYLLAPFDARPVGVYVDGQAVQQVHRDQHGGWYIPTTRNSDLLEEVKYRLMPLEGQKISGVPVTPAQFSGLDFTRNARLDQQITWLLNQPRDLGQIVRQLERAFAETFIYSEQDAAALNRTANITERIQHFIEHRKGVCYEFATAFAAVLEQAFNVPARLCDGHVSAEKSISLQGHRWVQYCDAQGQWHVVDPTPSSPGNRVNKNEQLVEKEGARSAVKPFDISNFHPNSAQHSQEELRHFSLRKLGLINWKIQREGEAFNAFRGVLDVKRLLRGESTIFRDPSLSANAHTRTLYIANFPLQDYRYCMRVTRPLQALLDSGVPIFIGKGLDDFNPLRDMSKLLSIDKSSDVTATLGSDEDHKSLVNVSDEDFMESLVSHYYESLLSSKNVQLDDTRAVKNCLFEAWEILGYLHLDDMFPIELTLHDKVWQFTQEDLQVFQMNDDQRLHFEQGESLVKLLDEINGDKRSFSEWPLEDTITIDNLIATTHLTPDQSVQAMHSLSAVGSAAAPEVKTYVCQKLEALSLMSRIGDCSPDTTPTDLIINLIYSVGDSETRYLDRNYTIVLRVLAQLGDKSIDFDDNECKEIADIMTMMNIEDDNHRKLRLELLRVATSLSSNLQNFCCTGDFTFMFESDEEND